MNTEVMDAAVEKVRYLLPPPATDGQRPIRVLLIEDDPRDVRLIREGLLSTGNGQSYRYRFHLETAGCLEVGLRRLSEGGIDVILLDLWLPDSQGVETLTNILAQAMHVPVIVLVGLGDEAITIEAARRGAEECFVKRDINGSSLPHAICYAIERHRNMVPLLQAKEEMLRSLSHELRTPLTIIQGYTEMLQGGMSGQLTPEQEEVIAIVREGADRLGLMVDRLLMLQALDSQTCLKIEMDLASWLREMAHRWQAHISAAQARLTLELPSSPLPTEGDPDLLGEAMNNLIDNAIKFSPNGGEIRVRAWEEGANAMIAIADQGIGISPEEQEKVFEPFHQADGSLTRRFGGMGIGLALCKKIVEKHGGRISAKSKGRGHGSTFYIALPMLGLTGPGSTSLSPSF